MSAQAQKEEKVKKMGAQQTGNRTPHDSMALANCKGEKKKFLEKEGLQSPLLHLS